jgi:hypothetical protein
MALRFIFSCSFAGIVLLLRTCLQTIRTHAISFAEYDEIPMGMYETSEYDDVLTDMYDYPLEEGGVYEYDLADRGLRALGMLFMKLTAPHRRDSMVKSENCQRLLDRRLALQTSFVSALTASAPAFAEQRADFKEDYISDKIAAKKIESDLLTPIVCIALTDPNGSPYWNDRAAFGKKTAWFFLDPFEAAAEYRNLKKRLKANEQEVLIKLASVQEIYRPYIRRNKTEQEKLRLALNPGVKNVRKVNRMGSDMQGFTGVNEGDGAVPVFFSTRLVYNPTEKGGKSFPFYLDVNDFKQACEEAGLDFMDNSTGITTIDNLIDSIKNEKKLADAFIVQSSQFQANVEKAFAKELTEAGFDTLQAGFGAPKVNKKTVM